MMLLQPPSYLLHMFILVLLSFRYCLSRHIPSIQEQRWNITSLDEASSWRPASFSLRHLGDSVVDGGSGATVSSISCNNLRIDPYSAELELTYYYRIDFVANTNVDISVVENYIHQAVVDTLNECDAQDRPLYALDLSPNHVLMEDANCTSFLLNANTSCILVKAATFILLDNGTQHAQALAYGAIQASLSNLDSLHSLQPNIQGAQFLGSEQSRVVLLPKNNSQSVTTQRPFTAKVAIAIASVSFVLAAIFALGVLRRISAARHRESPVPQPRKDQLTGRVGIMTRGEYFEHLTDEEDNDRSVTPKFPKNASFVLSPSELSDITFDDSASNLSTISRATTGSRLERIEEEGEGPYDEEAAYSAEELRQYKGDNGFNDDDDAQAVYHHAEGCTAVFKLHTLRSPEDCRVHVIEDYGPKRIPVFSGDEDKASDLVGCKFLDDGSLEGEPVAAHEAAPMEDWNTSDDSIVRLEHLPAESTIEEETEVVLYFPGFDHDGLQESEVVEADEWDVDMDTFGKIISIHKDDDVESGGRSTGKLTRNDD